METNTIGPKWWNLGIKSNCLMLVKTSSLWLIPWEVAPSFPVRDLWLPGWHTSRTKHLCSPVASVPAHHRHSRNFPLNHNTLGRTTIVWVKMSGKDTTVEETIIEKDERRGSDRDKNRAGTCNLKKWEPTTLEVLLNWMNWRQRPVKCSHHPWLQLG